MFREKIIWQIIIVFAIFLSSCAQNAQPTSPPISTPVPGTNVHQQLITVTPNIITQTAEPVTSKPVLNLATVSSSPSGLKPPDSQTPAAGICGEAQEDPVSIVLGVGPDGIPLAGRCIKITPVQRIKLINQSSDPFNMQFGEYTIDLPVGDEILLEKPVGQYLALGVHFLSMGPELWVKEADINTAPPTIVQYENSVVGFRLSLPGDWLINETNSTSKEVIFSPPNPEPFVAYLSISLDDRTLDQIIQSYTQHLPDSVREDTIFNGFNAIIYHSPGGRSDYFIPYGNQIFMIVTDKPNDVAVQSILNTIQFATLSSTRYEATIIDNGKSKEVRSVI